MASGIRFKFNGPGVRDLLNEDFVRKHLTQRAERVLADAQSGQPDFDYHIEQAKTDRVVVRVGSDDEGVLFAESDTGNLLRALDAGSG